MSKSPDAPPVPRAATLPGGTPTEKAPEPELTTERIPAARYTSREFADLEWERLWTRTWLYACHVSDVAEPGQVYVLDVGRESLAVVRTRAGELKAFLNVCQHRGRRILRAGPQHARKLTCPFHLWTWELDGRLADVPDADTYPQGIDEEGLRLSEVRCEEWGGLVFVNLDRHAEPLTDFLGVVVEHLGPYRFETYELSEDTSVEWNCNWKTSVDAFNEAYHSMGLHPEIALFLDDFRTQIDLYERHSRFLVPQGLASPRLPGSGAEGDTPNPMLQMVAKAVGMDVERFRGDAFAFRRAYQQAKRRWSKDQGFDFSRLNDDQLSDDYHYTVFPNLTINLLAEQFWIFRQLPHPTDPDWMVFDYQVFKALPRGAQRRPRPEVRRGRGAEFDLGNPVLNQDACNLPHVQHGMHSAGFAGLWLSDQERRIRHFHAALMEVLEGPA